VAGLCPETEANLGDGIFPAEAFPRAGGRFGIGTDSNIRIGVAAELRQLEYAQRLAHRGRNRLAPAEGDSTGRALFQQALAGGNQAAGVSGGGLAVGARADLVSLDASSVMLAGRAGDALLDAWIFAASGGLVDYVWCNGKQVVAGGRHHAREKVAARYREVVTGLLAG
jgi:cytosine/adenosine deaminase-related metal-dependent hydrolase